MAYKVTKAPPLPETRGRPSIYPFATMAVGEGFNVPMDDRRKAISAAAKFVERAGNGWRFASRRIPSTKLALIWRVE